MKEKVLFWMKKESVLVISGIAAILSMLFVVPSSSYIDYIDYRVLSLLFCLMAVVAGLQKNGVFETLSEKVLSGVKTTRSICYVLVLLCFFSSMWITNDVALITFVPFAILMLHSANQNKYIIYVIVMQTIAANLGSMLTPVGNPQNLYLYSHFKLNGWEFLQITLPIVISSFILISFISFFVKPEQIVIQQKMTEEKVYAMEEKHKKYDTMVYFILFALCLGTVFHFVDYRITLIVIIIVIGLLDKAIFKKVDYSLLLTFLCFFIFVGNLGSMTTIRNLISDILISKVTIASIALSQLISNVPAAVLLSNFTTEYKSLIIGTNIGGLGTIIASLASLISYKLYSRTDNARPVKYLSVFSAANIGILIILYFMQKIWL